MQYCVHRGIILNDNETQQAQPASDAADGEDENCCHKAAKRRSC